MHFHRDGTAPAYNSQNIFVFGSNREGRHGKGAALFAAIHFDAEEGVWDGRTGYAYAIPTKHSPRVSMVPPEIQPYVDKFLAYARAHRGLRFHVTRIGCGLAGMTDDQIAPMFVGASENCSFAEEWRAYLCG